MALDYVIDKDCEVKRQLTTDGMISLVKQRDRARAFIDILTREGKTMDEAMGHTFRLRLVTPRGIEEKEQKVSDILESTRHIDTMRAMCKNCPITADPMYDTLFGGTDRPGRAFACYYSINYPISRKAEEWLAGRAKAAFAKGGVHTMAMDLIHRQRISGRDMDRLRRDSRFLELESPIEVVPRKSIMGKGPLNTSQVLYLLFGFPVMDRAMMIILLHLIDAITISDQTPVPGSCQLSAGMRDKDGRLSWWSFSLEDTDTDDRSILQIKEFFRTIFLACVTGRKITIDR